MKLIIEKMDGVLYAYREDERHFRSAEKQRTNRLDPALLADECTLDDYGDENFHFVFDIKKPTKKRKRK